MQKSTFITVLSWIFIVLSGFASLISVIQNIIYHFLIKNEFNSEASLNSDTSFENFFFSNFGLILTITLVLIVYSFISSIGLLKRKNWARISIIGLLALAVAYNFYSFISFYSLNEIFDIRNLDSFARAFMILSLILIIGLCSLFVWIIFKLNSKKIKAEFQSE